MSSGRVKFCSDEDRIKLIMATHKEKLKILHTPEAYNCNINGALSNAKVVYSL